MRAGGGGREGLADNLVASQPSRPLTPDCVEKGRLKRSLGPDSLSWRQGETAMMGDRRIDQAALFYEFSLERHVPADHMLRSIAGSWTWRA